MSQIKQKQTGITTVGGLMIALRKYPTDLPIGLDLYDSLSIWLEVPDNKEDAQLHFADARGRVEIAGEDSFDDEDDEDEDDEDIQLK